MYLEIFLGISHYFAFWGEFRGILRKYLYFASPRPREVSEALSSQHYLDNLSMYLILNFNYNFFVWQLDPNRCESCYGAETPGKECCNTCEDVREAYRRKGWALSEVDNIKQVQEIVTCLYLRGYAIMGSTFLYQSWVEIIMKSSQQLFYWKSKGKQSKCGQFLVIFCWQRSVTLLLRLTHSDSF